MLRTEMPRPTLRETRGGDLMEIQSISMKANSNFTYNTRDEATQGQL